MLFDTLSKKLAIPLVSFSSSLKKAEEYQPATGNGIVLSGANFKGLWPRIAFMLFRRSAVKNKVRELEKDGIFVSTILSVYPDLDNPLIVFNQSSRAEHYCQDNILPKMDWTFKGVTKRVLFLLGNVHPSVDSFILITGNTDKFQQINTMLAESSLNAQQDLLCITTSNPVFLSFSTNAVPDYVVHHAESGDFELRQELHQALNPLVSKPLAQIIKGEQSYFVESGLPGKPWFQLLKSNSLSMDDVKKRSLNTLKEFEQRIGTIDHWNKSIDVIALFNRQFEQSHAIRQFAPSIVSACSELVNSLPEKYLVKGTWQHGDYCINNLIFAEKQTYIIDFEEFGDTSMPLQDAFSLALSFYIQRETQTLDLLAQDLVYCLQDTDKNLIPALPLLFIYHLLFRLGSWGENPNRSFICGWLQNILIEHIENPNLLFSDFLAG
tara:strand:+ start:55 stop:1365 length:1311 start_codon:yes stop_codon:yes gene_type:complete